MTRQDLIKIGKETIEITEKGYYYKNNKHIFLRKTMPALKYITEKN